MRFSTSAILAVASVAFAQSNGDSNGSNPFNIPDTSLNTEAGETVNLTWRPTTEGTVTIYLRSGPSNALNKGEAIACTFSTFKSTSQPTPTNKEINSQHRQQRRVHMERPRRHRARLQLRP